jgi:membrane protein YdbS with pleckstrin-like domain
MPIEHKPGDVPTSQLYPLMFRKIIKKILVLEVSVTDEGRRIWRSLLGAVALMGILFLAIGTIVRPQDQDNYEIMLLTYILGALLLVLLIVLYEWLYIITYYYDVGETFIRIRKGVFIRREVNIPYNQIQNIEVDRDGMDHILGLYDLHISTAAEKHILEPHIDGLNFANCEAIQQLIYKEIEELGVPKPVPVTPPAPSQLST